MADLPGVGKKISFLTAEQQKVVVIIHHSGKRDLYFFRIPTKMRRIIF